MITNVGSQALANASQLAKVGTKRLSSQLPTHKDATSPTLDEATPQMAIVKRNNKDEVVLAPRKIKTKRMERTVLHEDKYLEHLDRIIQRDFYPEIPKLRAQSEYLEALAANDSARIRALEMQYSSVRTSQLRQQSLQRETPAPGTSASMERPPDEFDEEVLPIGKRSRNDSEKEASSSKFNDLPSTGASEVTTSAAQKSGVFKKPHPKMSVDKFLAKYTSEDNASFEELSALVDRREKVRNGWMYKAEAEHNTSKVRHTDLEVLPADNQIMLRDTQKEFDARPTNVDNWTTKARNAVLFFPEEAAPTAEDLELRRKQLEREIHAKNTRFRSNPFKEPQTKETLAKASMVQAAAKIGCVDASGNEIGASAVGPVYGGGAPMSQVATPSPMPGVGESPLMTWGEIEGTPFRLDAGDMDVRPQDAEGPKFKIPEMPLRDRIAHSIVDTLGKRYHEQRKAAIAAAAAAKRTPKFGSTRSSVYSMSPAAQKLASDKLGIRVHASQDRQLAASYSPRPPASLERNQPGPSPQRPASVRRADGGTKVTTESTASTVNRRPKATDFFNK